MKELFFELPIGLTLNGETHREVELLKTNGIAEKVFVKKIQNKPFTWQGNVVSIAVKGIGTLEIGAEVRKKYLQEGSVTIPLPIRKLPLAEINTLLVEIHRRVWVSKIPKQEVICKYCGKKLIADIDLDKIDYTPEDRAKIDLGYTYSDIVVNLEDGFIPPVISKITDKPEYAGICTTEFNRIVFRPPLLEDAIRHESWFSDSIGFWRRIALDCLVSIEKVDEEGNVTDVLPEEFKTWYGLRLFNEYLSGKDLRSIREQITTYLPTLPFAYNEPCGCDEQRDIPMVMEASSFFSE